ncbi:GapA-binding peptide SR1P [Priestia endophytica]|uniref:GapA-binding peptide SR1P n=1 Tax=Priestia endophytica TaxID=135735 RepID=A0AAX1Q7J9_9BACI|nr:GapA-binding peptide SR1P [Priestia endophytica]RAS76331.1 GapA-binding peptide SR1P [Priestia endophytica]RAS91672.1 GapA-binding peptide SR1P [Priestia endophytica]
MGTLICQECTSTVDHFEDKKVSVYYTTCQCCKTKNASTLEK